MATLVRKLPTKSSGNRPRMFDDSVLLEKTNRTFIVCVLLIDIVGYSKRSVSSQRAVKEHFNAMLTNALANVPRQSRIEVDTGDGAATAFFGDPEDAFFAALAFIDQMRTIGGDCVVRIGINLGPIKVICGVSGNRKLIGDGISDAEAVMAIAAPGQVVVSHSYFDMLARICDSHPRLFACVEMPNNKHRKARKFYRFIGEEIDAKTIMREIFDRAGTHLVTSSQHAARQGPDHSAASRQGVFFNGVMIAASVTVLLSVTAWWTLRRDTNSPPGGVSVAAIAPSIKGAAISATSANATSAQPESGTPETIAVTSGKLSLAVQPWGEIYVDGILRGISPPLKSLKLPVGKYRIEIRNGEFASYVETIEVQSGQAYKVTHRF